MLPVTDDVKLSYMRDGSHKDLHIDIANGGFSFYNNSIVQGSFSIEESILSGDSLEFVGCIASKLEVTIHAAYRSANIKGRNIRAAIKIENSDEWIQVFHGVVDSCVKEANKDFLKITAYDKLYSLSEVDVTDWCNSHLSYGSIAGLARDLLNYLGLNYVGDTELINGGVSVPSSKPFMVREMSALGLLKQICQINACYGIINRDGVFEFRYIDTTPSSNGTFPSNNLYPENELFPGQGYTRINSNYFEFYKKLAYEDFTIEPINVVIIRENESDPGVKYEQIYGSHNKYIIQGNIFARYKDTSILSGMAQRIFNKIHPITFVPFTSDNNGSPFLECGDEVIYKDNTSITPYKQEQHFFIFSRKLSGDQILRDAYKAEGNETQHIFLSSLGANVEDYSQEISDLNDKTDDLEDRVSALEEGGASDIVSVQQMPADPEPNVLYLIQGEIVIL